MVTVKSIKNIINQIEENQGVRAKEISAVVEYSVMLKEVELGLLVDDVLVSVILVV